ncbi:MAG: PhoH family protein [Firmicutes bacterium]|nr:PhoH family protein [Bacillota bacterium]
MTEETLKIEDNIMIELFGSLDENMRLIEKLTCVKASALEGDLTLKGEEENTALARDLIEFLISQIKDKKTLKKENIAAYFDMIRNKQQDEAQKISDEVVLTTRSGKQVKSITLGQAGYVSAIKKNKIVFGIGPAGTGKTYLSTALAVLALKKGEVQKIILTRPAIEAGEQLGFLPGDLNEKVDPYLRPLFDALGEMLGAENYARLIEKQTIEVAPLAFMRGRTLKDAFIILDEAQNTTCEQMKMFLTRLGENSRMVINGDITQIDLAPKIKSGLKDAMEILNDVEDIKICHLSEKDIVRHELVRKIVAAYANRQNN